MMRSVGAGLCLVLCQAQSVGIPAAAENRLQTLDATLGAGSDSDSDSDSGLGSGFGVGKGERATADSAVLTPSFFLQRGDL